MSYIRIVFSEDNIIRVLCKHLSDILDDPDESEFKIEMDTTTKEIQVVYERGQVPPPVAKVIK